MPVISKQRAAALSYIKENPLKTVHEITRDTGTCNHTVYRLAKAGLTYSVSDGSPPTQRIVITKKGLDTLHEAVAKAEKELTPAMYAERMALSRYLKRLSRRAEDGELDRRSIRIGRERHIPTPENDPMLRSIHHLVESAGELYRDSVPTEILNQHLLIVRELGQLAGIRHV